MNNRIDWGNFVSQKGKQSCISKRHLVQSTASDSICDLALEIPGRSIAQQNPSSPSAQLLERLERSFGPFQKCILLQMDMARSMLLPMSDYPKSLNLLCYTRIAIITSYVFSHCICTSVLLSSGIEIEMGWDWNLPSFLVLEIPLYEGWREFPIRLVAVLGLGKVSCSYLQSHSIAFLVCPSPSKALQKLLQVSYLTLWLWKGCNLYGYERVAIFSRSQRDRSY